VSKISVTGKLLGDGQVAPQRISSTSGGLSQQAVTVLVKGGEDARHGGCIAVRSTPKL
jgi:hypothetical protein